jgi:hypothetical protein
MSNTMKTFRLTVKRRACEAFGAVNYTLTDKLTEKNGGVLVETTARGTCEGERVDTNVAEFYPGASMDNACAYRIRLGYVQIA